MNWRRFHMSIIGILLLSTTSVVLAAPPPLGPPAPRAPIQDLGVDGVLTRIVRGQVDQTVTSTNMMAAQNPDVRAKVRVSKFSVFAPGLSATQYSDRPNQRFVRLPYIVQFEVYDIKKHTSVGWIGVPVERHISQSIDLQMFCDQWQTGQGNLKLVANIQQPYLENEQGTLEQVVNFFVAGTLTNYIDSKMRQQLGGGIQAVTTNLPGKCDALGAYPGQLSDLTDDTIQWSFHPRRVVNVPTVLNEISVKLLSLKRLAAHNLQGAVLYNPVETPALEFYANYQHYYVALQSLQENQQVTLNATPLAMNRPGGSELLVLIANVIQNVSIGSQPTDSAFRVFGRDANFGNGTQTIRIQKSYWQPPSPPLRPKPTQFFVDAYELTIQVNAPLPTMSPELTTAPGGVAPGTPQTFQAVPLTILPRGIETEPPAESTPGTSSEPTPEVPDQPAPAQPAPPQPEGIKSDPLQQP